MKINKQEVWKGILIALIILTIVQANGQSLIWESSYGGSDADLARSVVLNHDTMYVLSYCTSDDLGLTRYGGADILLSKMSPDGDVLWNRTFGGQGYDNPEKLLRAENGDLLIIGSTNSVDGCFSAGAGGMDGFVIRVNREGEIIRAVKLGGSENDYLFSGVLSGTGDLYVAGATESGDHDLMAHGLIDGWLAKLSGGGELIWQSAIGGSYNDLFLDIDIISDAELVACGRTRSDDQDIERFKGSANQGVDNAWIVLVDTNGVKEGEYCYGDTDSMDVSYNSVLVDGDSLVLAGGELGQLVNQKDLSSCKFILSEFSINLELVDNQIIERQGDYKLNDLVPGGGDSYYLIGSRKSGDGNIFEAFGQTDLYTMKLDLWLKPSWEHISALQGVDFGASAVVNSEGDLILTGSQNMDIYCAKLWSAPEAINEVFLCSGDSILINESYYTNQVVIYDSLTSSRGYDSIVAYNLQVSPAFLYEADYNGFCNTEFELHDTIVRNSGVFQFLYKTEDNCDSIYLYNVEIIRTNRDVEVEGATIRSLQEDALYQWYNCDTNEPVEGAIYQSYMVEKSGKYKVRVDIQGCLEESDCYYVAAQSSGVGDYSPVKIFPNPAHSFVRIISDDFEVNAVHVIDMLGSVKAAHFCKGRQVEIDLSPLSDGFYILRIETDDTIITQRIQKN